jgi:FG-GAP repeat
VRLLRVFPSLTLSLAFLLCADASASATVSQSAKLTASDGGPQDAFGVSVSISGDVIVAGTIVNAAYVFVKPAGGWQDMTQTAKLTPSDGVEGDLFGYSVAISGNVIVVGAPQATVNGNVYQGAAYVFVRPAGGWRDMTETAKLVASDGAAGDSFGQVAVSGRTALVGAPLAAVNGVLNQGAAYIFAEPPMGEWPSDHRIVRTETAKLTASDGGPGVLFGSAVSISDDTTAVGALLGNEGIGEAYVFVKPATGWSNGTETAALTSSDLGGWLGDSIATNGKTVAAGAPTHGTNGLQGAVYVFDRPNDGWANMTETAQLLAAKAEGWNFGSSVAIGASGGVIVTGAPQGNGHHIESGDAFVFVQPPAGWQTTSQANLKLFASDGQYGAVFGGSISLSGNMLVVGANNAQNGPPPNQGAAYVFEAQ